MAQVKEEDNLSPDDIVVPNELSKSVDDPFQSEQLNLTIRLQNDLGRKCYVDPHEAFPQATYYLDPNLKRPNYYLKKEQKFNKTVLLPNHEISPSQKSQPSPNRIRSKKKKKKSKRNRDRAQNQDPNNLKMEVESESDDDDEEEDDDEFDESNDSNVFDADDELFSASEVNLNASKGDKGHDDKDKNFLSVFPKRKQDEDQKSESYELDNDKIKKMKKGERGFSIDEDVFIDKTKKVSNPIYLNMKYVMI